MADSPTTLINGRAYDWSMLEFKFDFISSSETIWGIKSIKWKRKRKIEKNYGVGSKAISRGYGNWECDAQMTLDYNTQAIFQSISPDGTLHGLGEFDVIVHFAHTDRKSVV